MKVAIEVENRRQGEAIRTALADQEVRAFVVVMGELIPLPSTRARQRVLQFVSDHLAEQVEEEDRQQNPEHYAPLLPLDLRVRGDAGSTR